MIKFNNLKRNNNKNKKSTMSDEELRNEATSTYASGYNLIRPKLSSQNFNNRDSLGQRLRYTITNLSAQAVQSTAIVPTFAIPTVYGTNNGTRVGDLVRLEGLEIQMLLNYESIVVISPVSIRLMIIQLKSVTAALAANNILDLGSSGSIDITSMTMPFSEGKTFHTLYDKVFHLNAYGADGQVYERIKLKSIVKDLAFASGTAFPETGGVFQMLLISDSAAAPHPSINLASRMWYSST